MNEPAIPNPRAHRLHLEEQTAPLLQNCPVDGTNPDSCPLHELRALPLAARKRWIGNLSDSELKYLLTYHATCSAERNRTLGFAHGSAGSLADLDRRGRV